mmetsp:Transcript_20914/g.52851  ORF Transcript_20914/g.52851 Transcript_20914/m.52851 type:complete len:229 (-) Transcript_20914:103-789(-)
MIPRATLRSNATLRRRRRTLVRAHCRALPRRGLPLQRAPLHRTPLQTQRHARRTRCIDVVLAGHGVAGLRRAELRCGPPRVAVFRVRRAGAVPRCGLRRRRKGPSCFRGSRRFVRPLRTRRQGPRTVLIPRTRPRRERCARGCRERGGKRRLQKPEDAVGGESRCKGLLVLRGRRRGSGRRSRGCCGRHRRVLAMVVFVSLDRRGGSDRRVPLLRMRRHCRPGKHGRQ